ncbi:MAG TPA: preprotein translocase subunit YajC [Candidatus Omnitrophota bacterium]|nr:preprotein translocase subunit YajC [Candidatus Omnitrophota bacterium]
MPTEQTAHPLMTFPIIPYILIFFIFYFLIIKPQKDKQKEIKNMLQNIKKNDEVVTLSGMHGTVVLVKEKTVILRVDDNTKIEFDKEAIAYIKTKE